ncbi:MAG: sigma 54-interacting transcriptional regulator [Lentisphaeria bacterium]|nr:sigma 54-interacting transcriptional regulator [Lentisphaeria bacterium]
MKKRLSATPTEAILESISDGVFTVNEHWRVTSFNRAAEEITGIPRQEAIGQLCSEVFKSSMCGIACALRETLADGKPVIGRSGYIINGDGRRIPISVSTAVLKDAAGHVVGGAETFRDMSEIDALRQELAGRHRLGDLTSNSDSMRRVFEILPAVASSPSTVLVRGETGTGKELIARAIHDLSPRRDGPFVAVNCGALPDSLLESELFGYKAGAFTGAAKDKPGRFALARGGTLLLDEIGDISPALQIRLLRVLQEKVYEPLGSVKPETSDARVIAATNKNLLELVKKGDFREDLYYRVNVVQVDLPPLRDRKADIPLLADQMVERFNRLHEKNLPGLTPDALSLLMAHDWPGNVRELENVLERAFVLCPRGPIDVSHLPPDITARQTEQIAAATIQDAHDLVDSQTIAAALKRNNFNRLAAAKELGVHKTTLFRKIKKLGIELPAKDGRSR